MKAVHYLLVKAESTYNNTKKLTEDIEITTNTTIESVEHINRIVKVVDAPSYTILQKGDDVIIHHNILRLKNGTQGKLVESQFLVKDDIYYVPLQEVFMYKRGDEEWKAIDPFCFIKPIKYEKKEKVGSIFIPRSSDDDTYKGMVKNVGVITYINKELKDNGLNVGDKIVFSKNSEHEFEIDGEIYYKMRTQDIMGVYE